MTILAIRIYNIMNEKNNLDSKKPSYKVTNNKRDKSKLADELRKNLMRRKLKQRQASEENIED